MKFKLTHLVLLILFFQASNIFAQGKSICETYHWPENFTINPNKPNEATGTIGTENNNNISFTLKSSNKIMFFDYATGKNSNGAPHAGIDEALNRDLDKLGLSNDKETKDVLNQSKQISTSGRNTDISIEFNSVVKNPVIYITSIGKGSTTGTLNITDIQPAGATIEILKNYTAHNTKFKAENNNKKISANEGGAILKITGEIKSFSYHYDEGSNGGGAQLYFGAYINNCSPDGLIGHWTFEGNNQKKDLMGNFGDLEINGASFDGGKLKVGTRAFAFSKTYSGPKFKEKTLVAWAIVNNGGQQGGSILTIGKPEQNFDFDAIVYGERQTNTWMAGSGWFHRTKDFGALAKETTPQELVKIAISYGTKGNNAYMTIYRNDKKIAEYAMGTLLEWTDANTGVQFGLRHFWNGLPGKPWLDASIEEARIYEGVLTQEQISNLTIVK